MVWMTFFVFTVIAGLASIASAPWWPSGWFAESAPTLSFDCSSAVLPLTVTPEVPLRVVQLHPGLNNGAAEVVSNTSKAWPSADAFDTVRRCQLINRGTIPVAVSSTFRVTFRSARTTLRTGQARVMAPGPVVNSHEHKVETPILGVPNEGFVFYFVNHGSYFAEVVFPESVVASEGVSGPLRTVRLAASSSGQGHFTFPPTKVAQWVTTEPATEER